jgi:hypothetical protein
MTVKRAIGHTRGRTVDEDARYRRRFRTTRLIAGFMAGSAVVFGAFTMVFGVVAESQRIHGFHNAVVAALLLVLSAPPALAIARRPDRSDAPLMTLTVLSAAALITMVASLTIDPFTLPFVVFTGVLWTIRPSAERAVHDERPSWGLLLLVVAGAVPLIVYALGQAELQRTLAGDEHSQFFHWVEASFYSAGILFLGALAALRPRSHRMAGFSAGLGMSIFGLAALVLGGYASAVSAPWAWLATAGGAAFIWLVARDRGVGPTRQIPDRPGLSNIEFHRPQTER